MTYKDMNLSTGSLTWVSQIGLLLPPNLSNSKKGKCPAKALRWYWIPFEFLGECLSWSGLHLYCLFFCYKNSIKWMPGIFREASQFPTLTKNISEKIKWVLTKNSGIHFMCIGPFHLFRKSIVDKILLQKKIFLMLCKKNHVILLLLPAAALLMHRPSFSKKPPMYSLKSTALRASVQDFWH